MTQDEIIEMAKQAGKHQWPFDPPFLERFAELVAQHERERTVWTQKHWTEYEHNLVSAEREACAKICEIKAETMAITGKSCDPDDLAKAIRARNK
jgi:hypothetical protein